jgi:hypothetical protein
LLTVISHEMPIEGDVARGAAVTSGGIYWHPVSSRILEIDLDVLALAEAAQSTVG